MPAISEASWGGTIVAWLPSFLVAVLAVLAVFGSLATPVTATGRRVWVAVVAFCGLLALAATILQREEAGAALLAGRGLWPRLAASVGWHGPSGPAEEAPITERVLRRLHVLGAEVKAGRNRIAALEQAAKDRSIDPATAEKLEAFLARSGSHEVAVTSLTGDLEAYRYAGEITRILTKARWKAEGPETTAMFGSAPAVAINLYVPAKGDAAAANILASAFARFGVPYQSRVLPSGTVPEGEMFQLFVSRMP